MKKRLMDFLACPECHGQTLDLVEMTAKGPEIIEGSVSCKSCGRKYPVINGIPRMLPDRMRGELLKYHADFFTKYPQEFNIKDFGAGADAADKLKKRTLKSFGYQWNVFDNMFEEYIKHWESFIPDQVDQAFFKGKIGLDGGCGFGRHIYRSGGAGAEMIGLDLSEAAEAAYRNTAGMDNVHIVQGDIYNPPLKPGVFDFIYSLGVLHHLPDPEGGFGSLSRLLEKGQKIFIWCYDNEKPRQYAVLEMIRKLTTHMNFKLLYVLCFLGAVAVRVCFNIPTLILRLFIKTDSFEFPFEFYNKFPFRVLHADLFDLLSAPSTKYYNEDELNKWFTDRQIRVLESGHKISGWTVMGEK